MRYRFLPLNKGWGQQKSWLGWAGLDSAGKDWAGLGLVELGKDLGVSEGRGMEAFDPNVIPTAGESDPNVTTT